jgi:hypothetical protein
MLHDGIRGARLVVVDGAGHTASGPTAELLSDTDAFLDA